MQCLHLTLLPALKPRKASSSGSLVDTAETLPTDLGIPEFDLGAMFLGLLMNTMLNHLVHVGRHRLAQTKR